MSNARYAALAVFATVFVHIHPVAAQETPATAIPTVHTMSLDECVASALSRNADALTTNLDVNAAEEARAGVKGEFFPKVRAEGSVQQWDRPFELPFGPQTFRVRDAFTWSATASVSQPLTGLIDVYRRYKVESIGVDIAELRRQATRRDLAYRVADSYLRLLEAERLAEVARSSVAQLEAQRKQAQSLLANGIIGKSDALRAELALASARQREIQARGQIVVARGALAALIGTPADTALEPAAIASDPPAPEETSSESAVAKALAQRVELRELSQRIAQQDARASAQQARHYPTVSAIGSYLHVAGSSFQLKDSAFVGAVANWDVWDWGTTSSSVHVAETRREQAKLARASVAATIRVEVSKAFVEVESAKEALEVARAAKEQAEENFRIVSKRFEQNAATSFDVVDAEALLTSARAQIEGAFYGYLTARLALQRATGSTTPRLR